MSDDLKDLIKQASEAAKSAPDHLQEAAFKKAFDALSASGQQELSTKSKSSKSKKSKGSEEKKTQKRSSNEKKLHDLDRTAHPEINHNNSALDNSLLLLKAIKKDLGIDGLNAADIANILVDKFRCSITRQSVSRALNNANRFVNRHKEGRSVIFKIMAPGEEYLDKLNEAPKQKERKSNTSQKSKNKKQKSTSNNSSSKKVGPATAMSGLLENGFFKNGQSISDIIEKLKNDRGRTFKQSELSPVLLRWLRSGKLSREKNADNQYEYKQS